VLVAIHQPHYLPWLGYQQRMQQADLVILLTQIRINGAPHWLTVPVVQRSQKERGPAPFIAGLAALDFLFNQKSQPEELSVAA